MFIPKLPEYVEKMLTMATTSAMVGVGMPDVSEQVEQDVAKTIVPDLPPIDLSNDPELQKVDVEPPGFVADLPVAPQPIQAKQIEGTFATTPQGRGFTYHGQETTKPDNSQPDKKLKNRQRWAEQVLKGFVPDVGGKVAGAINAEHPWHGARGHTGGGPVFPGGVGDMNWTNQPGDSTTFGSEWEKMGQASGKYLEQMSMLAGAIGEMLIQHEEKLKEITGLLKRTM